MSNGNFSDNPASLGGEGQLGPDDMRALLNNVEKVLKLMKDGLWHTHDEIKAACAGAADYMRRARQLREIGKLNRRKVPGSRLFEYQFEPKNPEVAG